MNEEKNIDNSLSWDCQWLIGPITRQVHFASLSVRRRTGEWKVTYGPFPHLERFELSNIPLSFASNNLSLQQHFDELISLLSNSHYCSGVDLPQNISLEAGHLSSKLIYNERSANRPVTHRRLGYGSDRLGASCYGVFASSCCVNLLYKYNGKSKKSWATNQ